MISIMDWRCSSLLYATRLPPPSPPSPPYPPSRLSVPSNPKHRYPIESFSTTSTTTGAGLPHECSLTRYSRMLLDCTSSGSLAGGKAIHGRLLRCGIDPDPHLWDCLLDMYCKCGCLDGARLLFNRMPHRDVVAWTSLIAAYARAYDGEESVRLFREMVASGVWPNAFALASCLKACSVCDDLDFGQQLHGIVIKMQNLSDLVVASSLIDLYMKCGWMGLAEKVFFNLPEKDASSWNTLLGGYALLGEHMKVLELFLQLIVSKGATVSEFIFPTVIKCCWSSADVRLGLSLHCLLIKIGLDQDGFLSGSLIDMYSKFGLANEAYNVFIRTVDSDVVVWSSMISCFDQQGMNAEAIKLFRSMRRMGIRANHYTFASVSSAVADLGDQALAGSLHACILKNGFDTRKEVGNAILNMYMKNGAVEAGRMVFDTMMDRDTISWNGLLSGFHSGCSCEIGLEIFRDMLTDNIVPNTYTYISILRSCTSLKDCSYGSQVHSHILKSDLGGDSFLGRALVDMYASSCQLENACQVFDRMTERDVFSWTVIITGYIDTDQGEKAIICFRQMLVEEVHPNEFTISSCLSACSYLASLDTGRQFHAFAMKYGLIGTYGSSNLIDMYSKCGCLVDAEAAFHEATSHDVVSWNSLICGYAQHGYVQKALESFEQMIEEGNRPDEVTFICILSACSHAGLLEEGMKLFDSMFHVYGISPSIEHQRCMVDILCKAAKLDLVEQFIREMGLSSDISVWQTALGAFRMYGRVEFAERAAKKLFELDPAMETTYILMSNIYAAAGRWADVYRMRKLMAGYGIKKEPGCSWIEVDGQFHVFLAHDGGSI